MDSLKKAGKTAIAIGSIRIISLILEFVMERLENKDYEEQQEKIDTLEKRIKDLENKNV